MQRDLPIRSARYLLLCAPFLLPGMMAAQATRTPQGKPLAAAPGAPGQASTMAVASAPARPPTPAQLPAHRAEVTFSGEKLAVSADNSSLNQILREISQKTGIKITGGVTDERVFGKYGPASVSEVLASLLDGTGSNMMLVQTDTTSPVELILTPRHGGPTPPNPNAAPVDDDTEENPNPVPVPTPTPPQPAQPAPNAAAPPQTPAANGSQPDASQPGTDTNPNGVKSPQEIFEQLQRMRQPAPPQ